MPFMWFSQVFIDTSARLLRFMSQSESMTVVTFLFNFAEYTGICINLLAMVVITDHCYQQQIEEESKLMCTLNQKPSDTITQRLLLAMVAQPIECPSGYSVFSVNKSMLLGFIGAVIPFTVMLLQIKQN